MTSAEIRSSISNIQLWTATAALVIPLIFWIGYNYSRITALSDEVSSVAERQRDVRERLSKTEQWEEIETRVIVELRDRLDHLDRSDERYLPESRIPKREPQ